jgi:hypothetical protein
MSEEIIGGSAHIHIGGTPHADLSILNPIGMLN